MSAVRQAATISTTTITDRPGRWVTVVRVKRGGAVIVYRALWSPPIRYGEPARVESGPGDAHTIGYVADGADFIEPATDRMLHRAGLRRSGAWQLVGRDPVCRVVRVRCHDDR
jgi:hypothetical protein